MAGVDDVICSIGAARATHSVQQLSQALCFSGADAKRLASAAHKARMQNAGSKVYFRGVIEFSNACEKDCFYCGIRKSNQSVERYVMKKEQILQCADWAFEQGYGSIVLQSGEISTPAFIAFVEGIVREIKKRTKERDVKGKGLGITLCIGEQSKKDYGRLFEAGAHRYLLRIETSNPKLYARLHPKSHSFRKRLRCLEYLREIGYQVGTGVMIGLPEQTTEDLAADLLFFKEQDIDMIGMGPYAISRSTPLSYYEGEWRARRQQIFQMSLNMIALARLIMPDVNIAATTALQGLHPLGREQALCCGANVIMPIITPTRFRKGYLLYEGKPCIDEDARRCRDCLERRIKGVGQSVGWNGWGDSLHYKRRADGRKVE